MDLLYFATFAVALVSSILSGLAGGGGGFIMAPYWLVSGMTPAQGATTGAFMAIGMGSSSLAAYKGSGHLPHDRRVIGILLGLTFAASIVGPFFLQSVNAAAYKPFLAVITLLSLPFLFVRPKPKPDGGRSTSRGFIAMAALLFASSFVTSSAFSILMTLVLQRSFTLSTLQSTAVRRLIGIVQSVVFFAVLCGLGNFVLPHALAALLGGTLGSYIGTKFSLRKGERFAKYALASGAVISMIALLI